MRKLLLWSGVILLAFAGTAQSGSILISYEPNPAQTSVPAHFTAVLCHTTDTGQTVHWTFGDGQTAEDILRGSQNESSVSHVYDYPGIYAVSASISKTGAGEWSGTISVTVYAAISVTPYVGTSGRRMDFTADFLPPPRCATQIYWALGDGRTRIVSGQAGTNPFQLECKYFSPGEYPLTVEAVETATGAKWLGGTVVNVRGAITATPAKGFADRWTDITASVSPPAPHDMQLFWDLGDGATWSNGVPAGTSCFTLPHRYLLPGVYILQISGEDIVSRDKWYGRMEVEITLPNAAVLINDFEVKTVDGGVELTWDVSSDEQLKGYNIYRYTDTRDTNAPINRSRLIPAENNILLDDTVENGLTYTYTLEIVRGDDSTVKSQPATVSSFMLEQNRPNPFNPVTTIRYSIPEASLLVLAIYDVHGRLIKTLVDGNKPGGTYESIWDGRNELGTPVVSGVYLIRLEAGKQTTTKKMILLK